MNNQVSVQGSHLEIRPEVRLSVIIMMLPPPRRKPSPIRLN